MEGSEVALGSVLVLDGKAWTVDVVGPDGAPHACRASRSDADGKVSRVWCDMREIQPLGDGMLCLPGRVEKRMPRAGEMSVAAAAAATVTG